MRTHANARLTQKGRLRLVSQHLNLHRPLTELVAEAGISVRRAYKWLARYRSSGAASWADRCSVRRTQRNGGKVVSIEEAKLRHRLREIAADNIRWGRRTAYRQLRREGWTVNHKRVQRLWREVCLQRPTPRKRKRARPADGSVRRHRAEHPHQVWVMDFQFDATDDGRRLKFLT